MSNEQNSKNNSKIVLISSVVILILVFVVLVSKLGSGSKPSNSPDSPKDFAIRLHKRKDKYSYKP